MALCPRSLPRVPDPESTRCGIRSTDFSYFVRLAYKVSATEHIRYSLVPRGISSRKNNVLLPMSKYKTTTQAWTKVRINIKFYYSTRAKCSVKPCGKLCRFTSCYHGTVSVHWYYRRRGMAWPLETTYYGLIPRTERGSKCDWRKKKKTIQSTLCIDSQK